MKFLKKFWRSLVAALKSFWEWLKRLFSRKKKVKEEPDPPKEPEEEPEKPVEPAAPAKEESGKPSKEKVIPRKDMNLLEIGEQSNTNGFMRVHYTDGYRVVQEHFQSLEHLIDCLSRRGKNKVMLQAGADSSNKQDSSFSRVRSYHEAVQLMREGYTDILSKIEEGTSNSMKQLQEQYQRKKSILTSNFSGTSPSVPRHLMGLPDAMLNREATPKKTKTLHIVYATHAPWFVKGDTFIKAGTALLSAIQLIENSGVSVKLDCIFYAGMVKGGSEEIVFGVVPLKDYADRLNLQKLCFPIAHPAMLRRIGFRFLETVPALRNPDFPSSYGLIMSNYEIARTFKTNSKVVIINVDTISGLNYNVEQVINYIKDAAEK